MDENNAISGWVYREIDLSGITAPLWIETVQPSQSYDWMLIRIQASYESNGDDPSLFDVIRWRWGIPSRDQMLQDISLLKPRPPISLCLSPGIEDLTAGTTRPKQIFFPSPIINWILQRGEHFEIQIENQTALTGTVKVLYVGTYIMPKQVIRQDSKEYA